MLQLGDFQLTQGIVVDGTVTDHRGQPIEGVTVLRAISSKGGSSRLELEGMGVPLDVTDAAGNFRAAILAPGGWHLIFDSPKHRVTELTGVTEPAGRSEHGVRVIMDAGLSIAGRIDGLAPTAERPLRVQARRADEQPTRDPAVREGAENAIAGAVERAYRTLVENAYDPTIILTGGGASRILGSLEQTAIHRPNLVLHGLAHMLENAQ